MIESRGLAKSDLLKAEERGSFYTTEITTGKLKKCFGEFDRFYRQALKYSSHSVTFVNFHGSFQFLIASV